LLALEYMKTQSHVPDVILMDRHMPIMGGIEATRALRAEARWQSLPIIALSGDVMRAQQEEFLQAGATAYLAKPVQVEDLRHVLVNLKTEHRHVG
jgi:CheY-like chemotaxis protein